MSRPSVLAAKAEVIRSLEGEVVALLRRARRATDERARVIDPSLTAAGFQVLAHLREHGGGSQTQIGDALGMDKGTVSRQVQVLCELGLVGRTEDPTDRRALVVRLSDEGEQRIAQLERSRRAAYVARFDTWTTEELGDLVEQLSRYNHTLGR